MNHHDETAFTHFTEIAEAKQVDVRRMQAEVAKSILRGIGAMLGKLFKRSRHFKGVQVSKQG